MTMNTLLALIITLCPGCAPSTPEIPPPLPTYVTGPDGGRFNCTPNYQFCWPEPGQVQGGQGGW
jgi:hypothetical protein